MKEFIIITSLTLSLFGFAGGGGSSSGGGGGGGHSSSSHSSSSSYSSSSSDSLESTIYSFAMLGGAFIFVIIYYVMMYKDLQKSKLAEKKRLDTIDHNESEKEQWIHKEAERIFVAYQQDWSDYNLEKIKAYTTDRYFEHASLMLDAIDRTGRRNVVRDLTVSRVVLYNKVDDSTTTPIELKVMFNFGGKDTIEDVETKNLINCDFADDVTEYWNFIYDGKSLKLDGIVQSTESTPHLLYSIANFANENDLFYSPDWGRLALPTEGVIFPGSYILSSADVNNHVVGKWNDCLIQMYTYSANPEYTNSYYIVGQINVKKSYEGVIIALNQIDEKIKKPKGYERFELEWNDFNDRYTVYAASKDALPAFELLNPGFMAKLYEKNLPYNIEVKNNVIYIFAKADSAKAEDYNELFNILTEAYKELKI
jgi:hypothetical protein